MRIRKRRGVHSGSAQGFRVAGITVLCLLLFGVTACGSDATNDAGSTGETGADRQASLLANKMRICVQNTSSDPITLEWDSYMQNGKSEYLKPYELKKTLGPSAFDCAVSYAWVGSEIALLYIEGQKISIENAGIMDFYVRFEKSVEADLTSNNPVVSTWQSGITDDRLIQARVTTTGKLEPFDQIQVYPIDIRVFDAN